MASLAGGLDTCILTTSQEHRLEGNLCKKMRFMLKGLARRKSNCWLRTTCGIPTLASTLRIRRLRLFRGILNMMGDLTTADAPLPAVLLGSGHAHGSAQLNPDGRPSASCNPWLQQFMDDIDHAAAVGALPPMIGSVLVFLHARPFNKQAFEGFGASVKKLIVLNITWKLLIEGFNARNVHRCSVMHVDFAFTTAVNIKTEQWL